MNDVRSWSEIPGLTEESDIESIETGWFMWQPEPISTPFRGPARVRISVIVKLSPEGFRKYQEATKDEMPSL